MRHIILLILSSHRKMYTPLIASIDSDVQQNQVIAIHPENRVKTTTITGVQVRVVNIELFQKVVVSAHLFSHEAMVDTQIVEISGDDYAQWTNDDQTLVDIVISKLGFNKA